MKVKKKSPALLKKEQELLKFNKWLKSQQMNAITMEQYDAYLLGKGLPNIKKQKGVHKIPSYDVPEDRDPRKYPSCSTTEQAICSKRDMRERLEISKQYPVALAYSKGVYQVLLPHEIQGAGRKM